MAKMLWQPTEDAIKKTNMYRFMDEVNRHHGQRCRSYDDLYQWSVENMSDFYAKLWRFVDIKATKSYHNVLDNQHKMPGAKWFEGSRLNFSENLLRYRDERIALIFRGENLVRRQLTYSQLYDEVARVANALKEVGVVSGDRVVGFMPNMPESIIAMLAATSIGAMWSSCSPDFGIKGVLDRFGQIQPKVIFTANGYAFKGKKIDSLERIAGIVSQLPSIKRVVVVPYTEKDVDISMLQEGVLYEDFKTKGSLPEIVFEPLPFDHPLYIMYSSGTTGLPKCMVQGAGGILLHHLKELVLHTDLRRDDTIFYFTTCGWMMWNWLTSSLAVGATLVLYDGNPFYPDPGALWKIAEEEGITIFGTSAGYIAALQNSELKPVEKYDLSSLRTVLSTGSPLSREGFEFVYENVKADLQLASIAGGSDLNGCFALGNPMGPVYSGELQCRGLAMAVHAFDEKGQTVIGRQGELVCTAPFPSMPLYFWNDPDLKKYHAAYFDVYPGIWRHGDYVEITKRGGMVMYGRSDATLNPGGVRIGTAEIYRQMEKIETIEDSLVVGQNWKNDVRVILFVKLAEGAELTDELKLEICHQIRTNASPRHLPAKIIAVADIPYTLNMKKVEIAVKQIIQNQPVLNRDALKNPQALDSFAGIKALQEN